VLTEARTGASNCTNRRTSPASKERSPRRPIRCTSETVDVSGRSARSEDSLREGVADRFTDRQWAALSAAYHGGYFDSPRKQSGEELASTLDISAPAFHNHLRAVERKLFERAFGGSKPNDDAAD